MFKAPTCSKVNKSQRDNLVTVKLFSDIKFMQDISKFTKHFSTLSS